MVDSPPTSPEKKPPKLSAGGRKRVRISDEMEVAEIGRRARPASITKQPMPIRTSKVNVLEHFREITIGNQMVLVARSKSPEDRTF